MHGWCYNEYPIKGSAFRVSYNSNQWRFTRVRYKIINKSSKGDGKMNSYTVERVITGAGSEFDKESIAEDVTIRDAIVAYLKGFHTGHPCWIINNSTNMKMTTDQIENALDVLLSVEV